MLTILSESVQGKPLRNFRVLRWSSSNNLADSATKTFWQVQTLQKKFNFIEFLKMKLFFEGLPEISEYACLMDAPGVLSDRLFIDAIIASGIIDDKELLMNRLNILQRSLGRRPWSKNLYYQLRGVVNYNLKEIRQAIRPATKFSGYVRNASSVGTKSSKRSYIPEPGTFEWTEHERIDYLQFLTVGELTLGTPGEIFFTLTKNQKFETVIRITT